MILTISILRCPDDVPPQTREVTGGELTIGRGPDNAWVLPDPERVLSKRHCVIGFRRGVWQVADVSANGTFVNHEEEPIGAGCLHEVRDGDRLRLGSYEMELRLREAVSATDRGRGVAAGWAAQRSAPPRDVFGDDPFAPLAPADALDADPLLRPDGGRSLLAGPGSAIALPADFAPSSADPFAGMTQPDHGPAVADAFRPPQLSVRLPDDWDTDKSLKKAPDPAPKKAPAPRPPPAPSGDLLAGFLRGAELGDVRPADPEALMTRVGEALRAAVSGLRQTLMARATVKNELRLKQSMLRPSGNNPLKFAISDEEALQGLIVSGHPSDLGAADSIAEALRDIRLHELATMAAMQAGIRELLRTLDPAPLLAQGEREGGLLPVQRRARAFELFQKLHAQVTDALSDDFDSVFGKAFARAYEQALSEISARDEG